ncbi:diguanylate cyclase (GGDEF) domain-containing protein [Ruminococcus sp. YE71]|uniref:GGDEF domain-containing protein n=1 Tax=unclassified Ruminococcus TaxID=2608920 RepID=UPI0008826D26|nr:MULTISPECIES: GGDEF domain-containing protein [unclassified Ruminococcus]SDA22690.1 diguanylate cyclase (GGDEF) domain-containing protein [Ruminococcus sp. YE78]SFW38610.1 diguanylate cyclase (GGDEF) domain-containing protein [Ruminococcus sp. YE71]
MKRILDMISVLTMKINDDSKRQRHKNIAMSVIVCISAGIMLVMNIIKHSTLMTITSIILVTGFAFTGILAGVLKKIRASTIIMALLLTGVFTVFPISGGNEGFAVLWVLLIPLFSISLFGLSIGVGMNLYFTILVLVLFYSPLSSNIADLYTDNFIHRFPILFIADSVTAQYMALSTEYYYKVTRRQVYMDDMTGAFNRKYFIELLEDPKVVKEDLCISVIDVNGLKGTNDTLGHAAGDEMICSVPEFARKAFGKDVTIARMGGDEFAILTYGKKDKVADKIKKMKEYAEKHKGELINEVFISAGTACRADFGSLTPEGLYQAADKFMYEDKTAFYKQRGHDRRHR